MTTNALLLLYIVSVPAFIYLFVRWIHADRATLRRDRRRYRELLDAIRQEDNPKRKREHLELCADAYVTLKTTLREQGRMTEYTNTVLEDDLRKAGVN